MDYIQFVFIKKNKKFYKKYGEIMANNNSQKVILGLAISTAIGAGILYYLRTARNRPTPVLQKIGQTIVEVGEMLDECKVGKCRNIVERARHRAPSTEDLLSSVVG